MIAESISSYQSILNKFIDDKKSELDAKIRETQKKLSRAGSKQKKEIEQKLAELQQSKDFIDSRYVSVPVMSSDLLTLGVTPGYTVIRGTTAGSMVTSYKSTRQCSNCGKEFPVTRHTPIGLSGVGTLTKVLCPHCGHEQFI